MKLKKRVYRLLQAIFATEILVLATSIIHYVYIQRNDVQAQGVVSHFKAAVSLIVCNLLFLVTYLYRRLRNGQEYSEGSTTSAPSRQPNSDPYAAKSKTISMGSTIRAPTSVFTSTFCSSNSQHSVDPSRSIYESEPGIGERQWPSAGVIRGVSTI
ncbi:hypothetical protein BDQ17DRAFT_848870 [Cyathus striatus]|nr:hypothetical protein BDQ17DRAFT_848870 [Cyathus striatus]